MIADPRTDLLQCLETILIAELADNDAWDALAELARECDEEDLAKRCEQAIEEERDHLRRVRGWVARGQGRG